MSFIKTSHDHDDAMLRTASASVCARQQDRTKGRVTHVIGQFEIDFEMTAVQRRIVERLAPVYTDEIVETVLRPVLESHQGTPSIRLIDWMLTNFAKSRRVVITQEDGERINVFNAYKTMLAHYRRRHFDAFRRRLRIKIKAPCGQLETTIAQLNFYWWSLRTGILAWVRKHADEIEQDMNEVTSRRRRRRGPGQRRSELSTAPTSKVSIYSAKEAE